MTGVVLFVIFSVVFSNANTCQAAVVLSVAACGAPSGNDKMMLAGLIYSADLVGMLMGPWFIRSVEDTSGRLVIIGVVILQVWLTTGLTYLVDVPKKDASDEEKARLLSTTDPESGVPRSTTRSTTSASGSNST